MAEEAAAAAGAGRMKLAVASGKGGTGKTTVAVGLALAADAPLQYLDCDVEEPNAHIFLRPEIRYSERVELEVPRVVEEKCTYCGKCREICRFNAITVFGRTIMTFTELCHSCGGCLRVCPEEALVPASREIGVLEEGNSGVISFVHGRLRVGEAMAVPLIKAVKARARDHDLVILDAPPGTSCPVIATVKDADYTLLVSEPTPFGLFDLKLAAGVMWQMKRPFGVILNRADLGDDRTEHWCMERDIPIHLKIPFDRRIAETYARGIHPVAVDPELKKRFKDLLRELGR